MSGETESTGHQYHTPNATAAYQAKLVANDLCFNATEAILTNLEFFHERKTSLLSKKITIKGTQNGSITQKTNIDTNSWRVFKGS